MRTLHFGLRVTHLERSIAFYTAVGYEVVGSVPETTYFWPRAPDPGRGNGGATTGSPPPPAAEWTTHVTEGIAMDAVKTWTVQVDIDEHEDRTRAVARLRTGGDESLAGTGLARLNPADRNVPQIGDELAVARALSELSHRLLDLAARDIEQTSGVPAHPVL